MYVTLNNMYTLGVADSSRGENTTIILDVCTPSKELAYEKMHEVAALVDFKEGHEVLHILHVDYTQHPLQSSRWLVTILARRMTEKQSNELETPADYAVV